MSFSGCLSLKTPDFGRREGLLDSLRLLLAVEGKRLLISGHINGFNVWKGLAFLGVEIHRY